MTGIDVNIKVLYMKKIYLLLSFLSAFFLLSACSDDTEQCLYSPKVYDTGNLLSNKVKEEFLIILLELFRFFLRQIA